MAKETSKGHKKHADIKRPSIGQYARYEIGMLGAPCGMIKRMVDHLAEALKRFLDVTYLDADHQAGSLPSYSRSTDHISHDSITFSGKLNDYDRRLIFTSSDLLIVNGNHFLADQQIVFCTTAKRDSLHRKLDRLTDVRMIILDEDIEQPHDFLYDHLDSLDSIPIYRTNQLEEISSWVLKFYTAQAPGLKGLVLAGGKSQRMGTPKEQLSYHGLPQVEFATRTLSDAGIDTYISCRNKEQASAYTGRQIITDVFTGLGPFGAIVSAFREDPDSAWLVMACDQPLINKEHIDTLLHNRVTSKVATCFYNPDTGFPEPLITLWEPKAYPRLLSFLTLGYSCPRKVLINSDVHVVEVDDHTFMRNANTPAERVELLDLIKSS